MTTEASRRICIPADAMGPHHVRSFLELGAMLHHLALDLGDCAERESSARAVQARLLELSAEIDAAMDGRPTP